MIKREEYINNIKPFINKNIIKVLTGIRRSGKSTMLKLIMDELLKEGIPEENIILINFELKEYFNIKSVSQLDDLIQDLIQDNSAKTYLFFDEIQEVKDWEKLINSYFAESKFDIYITGSNSKLLSGELATYLAGRYVQFNIFPFSFKEYLMYIEENNNDNIINNVHMDNTINNIAVNNNSNANNVRDNAFEENNLFNKFYTKELFNEYLKFGGMPFSLIFGEVEKIQYLTDLYNSIVLKDIIQRHQIRDIDLLNRIFIFIMENIGQLVSVNNIVKYLKKDKIVVSINTIYNYLSYFEEACLVFKVPRENLKGKKLLNHIEKFYLVDLGFRESICGNNNEDIGQVIENIVYMELLRRGFTVNIGKIGDKEVDFVCRKQGKPIYVQVSYILANEYTVDREFTPLLNIKDNFPKYLISMDEFDMSRDGIKHINLIDFLLGDLI